MKIPKKEIKPFGGDITGMARMGNLGFGDLIDNQCASFAIWEAGNFVMWFGQNQISEEREKRLWPNNPYFGNYFVD